MSKILHSLDKSLSVHTGNKVGAKTGHLNSSSIIHCGALFGKEKTGRPAKVVPQGSSIFFCVHFDSFINFYNMIKIVYRCTHLTLLATDTNISGLGFLVNKNEQNSDWPVIAAAYVNDLICLY